VNQRGSAIYREAIQLTSFNATQNLCPGSTAHSGMPVGRSRSYGTYVLATLTSAKVLCSSRLPRKGHDYQRFPTTGSSERG
jgi:hypothetical protein